MSEPPVLVRRDGRVAVVTLNRPHARNALDSALLDHLFQALQDAADDPDVGVVVLTGNGPSFCAGADLKESAAQMADGDFWTQHERVTRSMRVHQVLPRLAVPVVAAVRGHAVAGGLGLAMSCDVVFAGDGARFGFPEVRRGLVAAMAMVPFSRVVGRRHGLDVLLSGRTLDAAEALRLGMVNRVVPDADLMDVVMEYATAMAESSPTALRVTKDLFRQVREMDVDRALEYARDVNLMIRGTRDAQAGAAAFARKEQT